jgi:hypothetical protein
VGNLFAKILENISNGKLKNISLLDLPAMVASVVSPSGNLIILICVRYVSIKLFHFNENLIVQFSIDFLV